MRQLLLLIAILLLSSAPVEAKPQFLEELAFSKPWLRVLHMGKDLWGGYESRVDAPSFFLAKDGKTSPLSELKATLHSFQSDKPPRVGPLKLHPLCAFPARRQLVETHLKLSFPKIRCEEEEKWRKEIKFSSVSLIFSSAYAHNPSSMFGHTFLKLNATTDPRDSGLLDHAVSFGAFVDTSNPFSYTYRGLAGGFKGYFSVGPYYDKVNEYVATENRDLWEYRLELSPYQLELLNSHLWELYSNSFFDYFFLDENCSYHLLGILEVLNSEWDLIHELSFPVLPSETIKVLERKTTVTSVRARPSQRRQMLRLIAALDEEEKELFQKIITEKEVGSGANSEVLNAVIRFTQFQKFKNDGTLQPQDEVLRQKAIASMAERKTEKEELAIPVSNRPDHGHGHRALGLGAGVEGGKGYSWLEGRLGYHELGDPDAGYESGLQINYLKFRLHNKNNKWKVSRFNIVDVYTLPPLTAVDPLVSWHVSLGLMRHDMPLADKTALLFRFGAGATLPFISEGSYLYLLPTVSLHAWRANGDVIGRAYPTLLGGLMIPAGTAHKLLFSIEKNVLSSQLQELHPEIIVELKGLFRLNDEWRGLLAVDHQGIAARWRKPEISLGVQRYF